jgi:hypothetical protein
MDLPLIAHIFAANALTLWFGYGLWRGSKIYTSDQMRWTDFLAIMVPLGIVFVGLLMVGGSTN